MMSAIYETGLEVSTGTHSILPAQWHYAGRQISMVFHEYLKLKPQPISNQTVLQ